MFFRTFEIFAGFHFSNHTSQYGFDEPDTLAIYLPNIMNKFFIKRNDYKTPNGYLGKEKMKTKTALNNLCDIETDFE